MAAHSSNHGQAECVEANSENSQDEWWRLAPTKRRKSCHDLAAALLRLAPPCSTLALVNIAVAPLNSRETSFSGEIRDHET